MKPRNFPARKLTRQHEAKQRQRTDGGYSPIDRGALAEARETKSKKRRIN